METGADVCSATLSHIKDILFLTTGPSENFHNIFGKGPLAHIRCKISWMTDLLKKVRHPRDLTPNMCKGPFSKNIMKVLRGAGSQKQNVFYMRERR